MSPTAVPWRLISKTICDESTTRPKRRFHRPRPSSQTQGTAVPGSGRLNFPAALAEAALIEKGEEMEWLVEDRNTFVLRRIKPKQPVVKGEKPLT
jgi:hypothetical protein